MTRLISPTQSAWRRVSRTVKTVEAAQGGVADPRSSRGLAQSGVVRLWNRTGTQLEPGQIVGLGDPIAPPDTELAAFRDLVGLEATVPTAGDAGDFAVVPAAIPDGSLGMGVVSGVQLVKVNVVDAGHGYADVTVGEVDYLTSAVSGSAKIVAKPSGTGIKWAYVLLNRTQAAAAFDWGLLAASPSPGQEQTFTAGAGFSALEFASGQDNDGYLSADPGNDRIVVTSEGFYLTQLSLIVFGDAAGYFETQIRDDANAATYSKAVSLQSGLSTNLSYTSIFTFVLARPNIKIFGKATTCNVDVAQADWVLTKAH